MLKVVKLLLFFCLLLTYPLYSQTVYYYYKDKRIAIEEVQNKKYFLLNTEDTTLFRCSFANSGNQNLPLEKVYVPVIAHNNASSPDYWWCITDINEQDYNFQNYVYKSSSYCTSQGDTVMLSHLFYVKLKRAEDIGLLESLADSMRVSIVGHDIFMPLWYTLSCTRYSVGNALQAANLFYESGLFAAAEPDFFGDVNMDCVNDTYASSQWGLNNTGQDGGIAGVDIRYCQAREITQGSSDIIVAIVDQGLEFDHPDLSNVHPVSYDARTENSPSQVYGYHGMHCAGVVGAASNNNLGVTGIAPVCPLMSISDKPGLPGATSHKAAGINFAWHNGASVISNSWHVELQRNLLDNAIDSALNFGRGGKGCVLVFASGNMSKDSVFYPANQNGVISVGAIDRCGSRAGRADSVPSSCDPWGIDKQPGSNYGNKLSMVAPGTNIYTIDNQGQAGYNTMPSPAGDYCSDFGGTSAATPHVAGVAALVLSVNPCLTYEEVIEILESTCTKIRPDLYTYGSNPDHPNGTWNNEVGYGLVNAYEALLLAQSYLLPDTITTTATWNEKKRIYADLIIDSLATLTITDTLFVAGGSSIIVRPGGKLVVNGGTLTNACDGEMWQGIIVEGNANLRQAALAQGSVILNNATIENARDAISTRGADNNAVFEHTGGIIQATNTLFRNNRRSVE